MALTIVFVVAPALASADDNLQPNEYFEFNPDYFLTQSLNVSSSGTIAEDFLPANEFLGGFDFWFDNAGSSGPATFELLDDNSNTLVSKTINIAHINPVAGGERVHVAISQIPVIASNKYKIQISSSLPELQIYYGDRTRMLGHNEPYVSNYLNGAAEINGVEKEFSFKYGLYETIEHSAPIVSNIAWTVIAQDQMRVDFNANEPVDYKIEYGPLGGGYGEGTSFTGDYKLCSPGIDVCSITIPVSEGFEYQYIMTLKDSWGNESQSSGTFTSGQAQTPAPTPPPSGVFPAISNLRAVDITNNSAGLTWTTNEPANSYLVISFPVNHITVTAASDPTIELEHYLATDPVLSAGNNYLATVRSVDVYGNEVIATASFSTLNTQPTPAPSSRPTPIPTTTNSPQATSSVPPQATSQPNLTSQPQVSKNPSPPSDNGSNPQVEWSAPLGGEPSGGYRVDIFDSNNKLVKTINVGPGVHQADVSDLPAGDYKTIVYQNDDGVYKKVAKPEEVRVNQKSFLEQAYSHWPYIIGGMFLLVGLGVWKILKDRAKQATISSTPS